MHLVDGISQHPLQVGDGPMSVAVVGHTSDGRLDKVMEGAEEVAQHAARSDDPDGGVGELGLQP